jgi:hypothetical protein
VADHGVGGDDLVVVQFDRLERYAELGHHLHDLPGDDGVAQRRRVAAVEEEEPALGPAEPVGAEEPGVGDRR